MEVYLSFLGGVRRYVGRDRVGMNLD